MHFLLWSPQVAMYTQESKFSVSCSDLCWSRCAGIRILQSTPGGIGRRERFILSIALGVGLGVTIIPQFTQSNLWPITADMSSTMKGFRDAVIITISTGYRFAPDPFWLQSW